MTHDTENATRRPAPPDDLADEALLEWERVVDELAARGRLDRADRAVLTLYARTWASWDANSRAVAEHGSVIRYPNKTVGESPFYKAMQKDRDALLRLLTALELTPAARGPAELPEPGDLDF